MTGSYYVGGVVGDSGNYISNCYNTGSVTGSDRVGGVAGDSADTISNCYNTGSVTGGFMAVGGVAGYSFGSIINCNNTGSVTGSNFNVGGVAGYSVGFISNCNNTGSVTGGNGVGGVAGYSTVSISNCYNTGSVTGSDRVGGVAGDSGDTISNCYYQAGSADKGISGQADAPGKAESKTATAFTSGEVAYRLNTNGSFDAVNWLHWTQNRGDATPSFTSESAKSVDKKITFDYTTGDEDTFSYGYVGGTILTLPTPPLNSFYTYTNGGIHSQAEMENFTIFSDLIFTVDQYNLTVNDEGVIEIATAAELTEFARYVNDGNTGADAKLTADIELNKALNDDPVTNWEHWGDPIPPVGLKAWIPIGNDAKPYAGTFDGADYSVSGVYINSTANYQALFGVTAVGSSIKNLGVTASYIKDEFYVGGIVGHSWGSISNCYNTGSVTGSYIVGGVAGYSSGFISNCYNTGSVTGSNSVGGVTGYSMVSISNCYNTGSVTGIDVGGVVGYSNGSSTNCYYQAGSAALGISNLADAPGKTVSKPATAFASGEVTRLLQDGQVDPAVLVWGQKLTGTPVDKLPLLKAADKVYCVTFEIGNGITAETKAFVNKDGYVTPPGTETGYVWKDANKLVFDASTAVVEDISVKCSIAIPTATATYGDSTKLGDIALVGGSVTAGAWSWDVLHKDTLLAVGNSTAYSATYTPTDSSFTTETFSIVPVINRRSLTAAEVTISQPANDSYTGTAIKPTVTVTDSGAVITNSDYTITYTNNTNPGTATVTVTGQGNYQGTMTRNFTIYSSGGGAPPSMSGITVTPGSVTFDPSGNLVVDITGLPAGATVYYSLDGITYGTTPPAITSAGEHKVYIKITCPGYQDYTTQTTVTVAKHEAPVIPGVRFNFTLGQQTRSTDLGALLPPDRGQTGYQLGIINDPGEILSGPPTIDQNGLIAFLFRNRLSTGGYQPVTAATVADKAALSATITVLVTMENYTDTTITLVVTEAEPIDVRYLTHIQDYGWENDWVSDGALSGTVGESKRLEALKIELTGDVPADAAIETSVHVQNKGDLGPFAMGSEAGTSGLGLRLERIQLELINLPGYTLYYNVHVQNKGWLRDETDVSSWFVSGEDAGTTGESLRLESIRIKLVKNE